MISNNVRSNQSTTGKKPPVKKRPQNTVTAETGRTRIRMSYFGPEANETAELDAQQFVESAERLAEEKNIFYHGYHRICTVFNRDIRYHRMSRIPDPGDHPEFIARKINNHTFWLGISTRKKLWLLTFYRKNATS